MERTINISVTTGMTDWQRRGS